MTRHLLALLVSLMGIPLMYLFGPLGVFLVGAATILVASLYAAKLCWTCPLWKENQK
jgi:hypothetical protein